MNTSEQINELATALSKAQGALTGAKKDAANPFFKSKYADLESVWDACREALSKNGLSVVQTIGATVDSEKVLVTTMLTHTSGQWIRDTMALIPKDTGPQAMGSCITYGRRYALAAIVGVYQTDDDAEAATARNAPNGNKWKSPEHQTPAERSKATKDVNAYSKRILEALNMDMDSAAADVMREAKDIDENFMADIWHTFSTPVKNRLRAIQEGH